MTEHTPLRRDSKAGRGRCSSILTAAWALALALLPAAATAAPQFGGITPADGTVIADTQVNLAGTVQDAVSLEINGDPVTLAGNSFSTTFALQEGTTSFVLIAADAGGAETQVIHQVVRDTTPPLLTVSQPVTGSVIDEDSVLVAGTALDPHLAEVLVEGQPAALSGASFSLTVNLVTGTQSFAIVARDTVGNQASSTVQVTYDPTPPVITITESGLPLADGSAFNRVVTPIVAVSDNVAVASVETLLDGAPFTSGTPVSGEGSYSLAVTAIDTAGNSRNLQVGFEIDLTPPQIDSISPPDGSLTTASDVTLSGTTIGAASVSVDGTAVSFANDSFTAGPFALTDGAERTFLIVASDAAGNQAQRPHRVERDSTAPSVAITAPAPDTLTASSTIAVSGTATDPHLSEVRVDGQLANLAGNSFSVAALPLSEGTNVIEAVATDSAGNASQAQVSVTLDTQSPQIRVLAGGVEVTDGAAFSGSVTLVIEVNDASTTTVEATLDGAPFTSGSVVSGDGIYELIVLATDALDHTTSRTLGFTLDSAPPEILSVDPEQDLLTSATQVTISGQVTGADTVTVGGQAAELTGEFFTIGPLPLSADGEHSFTIVATDRSGNSTQIVRRVVRDATPPALAIGQPPADAVLSNSTVDVSGTAGDAHLSRVTVNAMEASLTGSSYLARLVPLVEGDNEITVVAEDEVGLTTERTRTVVLDTEAPEIAITDPADGTVVPDETLTISGTASDSHLDRVEVDGRPAQIDGNSWSVSVALEPGSNNLTARAFDTLGHSAEATVMVFRDSEAPSIQIDQPAEGLVTSAANVEVSGTVEDDPEITVTVEGNPATVTAGTFTATAELTAEGVNRLIARATDAQGNQGTHTREVIRDTVAPEWLAVDPADGALAIATGTSFRLTFSELLAEPAAGAWRLETEGATPIAATDTFDDDVLVITPDAALPSATGLTLVLTGALVDFAGNALANPQSFSFTTVDTGAPPAPSLNSSPALYQCATEVVLAGTTEPEAAVRATGGAATVENRADEAGAFSLTVPLVPDVLNHLEVIAIDLNGGVSPPAVADVVQDCQAPRVLGAEREGDVLTLTFDEAMAAATVAPAITVQAGGGTVAGSVVVSSELATFTAGTALPADGVRLEVSQTATDLAGNPLAYPYAQIFGAGTGDSFFSGTVIDDATGRPLAGVRVVVTATGGVALPEPQPDQITGPDGRFLIAIGAGTHDVTIARDGYTPALRAVTTVAGQGTDVFDPRLTPVAVTESLGTGGGTVATEGGLTLVVPPGALASSGDVGLTGLDEQALPVLLPYGWSPRGAVWIDLPADLTTPADLTLPVAAPDGTVLTLAELDLVTLQWRATDSVTAANGTVNAQVSALGAYAAVDPDTGALAPPTAILGQMLGSSPAPAGDEVTGATLTFDPEVILPTQRSRATALFELGAEVASGVPLTLEITEELELLDGTIRREAPYRADLVIYRALDGTPRAHFWLEPSEAARQQPIRLGAEDVDVLAYGDESVRGDVLGPQGGSVANDQGDTIDVPAGALEEPSAVVLHRRDAADLPLPVPTGTAIDAVIEVDLGGATLSSPATLAAALDPPPAGSESGILLQVIDAGGGPTYRAVAEIEPTAGGWSTTAIDAGDLPWPGVTSGGLYAFARFTTAHGFLRGVVLDVGATPLEGALITSPSVDWVQLSNADGSYVLPLPLGSASVSVEHPNNGNQATLSVDITTAGERVDGDPTIQVVAPRVVETTPAGGAVEQPIGIQPSVRFSEPVDRASLDGAIELLLDGEAQTVELVHQGALVTVVPEASLLPGRDYQLRITTGVRDLDGYVLPNPVTVDFTTQVLVLPDEIDPSRITLFEPDAGGQARVLGLAGATPAEHLVFVENRSRFVSTPSVTSGQDGSFDTQIEASVEDLLILHILIPGANEVLFPLTPFVSADGRAVWAGPGALNFTTSDGVTLRIEEGTFTELARVEFTPRQVDQPPIAIPEALDTVAAFELDFGGARALKALQIELPATAETPEGVYLLNRLVDAPGGQAWMMHDLMWRDGDRLTTADADAPDASSAPSSDTSESIAPPETGTDGPVGLETRRLASRTGLKSHVLPPVSYKEYVPGAAFPGIYHVENPLQDLGYLVLPFPTANFFFAASALSFEGIVTVVNQEVSRLLAFDGVLIPALLDRPFELEVRELATGYLFFSDTFDPPPEGGLVELEPDNWTDTVAPVPIGGSPIRFFQLLFADQPQSGDLDDGISYTFDPEAEELRVTGEAGSVNPGAEVRWLAIDGEGTGKVNAGESGAFVLEHEAHPERRYVIAVSALIIGNQGFEIRFSEGLDSDSHGISVRDADDREVFIDPEPIGSTATMRLLPPTAWRAGETYTLELLPELADPAGNEWGKTLSIEFKVEEGEVLDTEPFFAVRDSARLGSLVFVAADRDGLFVFDASDPADIKPYIYRVNGEEIEPLGLPFANADAVRGVAVDPHGRVLVTGGGTTNFGQLKILDPLALDPEAIAAAPDDPAVLAAAFRGSTVISDQLGAVGTQLPAGTPRKVAVLSNDEIERWAAGKLPEDTELELQPTANAPYSLTVSGRAAPDSTVEVNNADGEDAETTTAPTGNFTVTLQVRPGDRLELVRDSETISWLAGQQPGGAISVMPRRDLEPFDLTVTGCAQPNVPVTLRDLTRGRWQRVDAVARGPLHDPDTPCDNEDPTSPGYFQVQLEVYPGDQLELVRNVDSLAYVATLGAGIEVVDVNSFYNEAEVPTPHISNVLGIYSGYNDPNLMLCGQPASDISSAVVDLGTLFDLDNEHPLTVAGLAAFSGLVLLESNANNPGQISFVNEACAQDHGNDNVSGLEILQDYPFDFDNDGSYGEFEYRDWAVISHRVAGILIYDITNRKLIEFAGRIPLPGVVADLHVDRSHRLLYASAYGDGIYVIDFDRKPFDGLIDDNDDDVDDRLLEIMPIGGNNNAPLHLVPELGLGFAGGLDRGFSSLVLGEPKLQALTGGIGSTRQVGRLAPLGVPTGPENPNSSSSPSRPSSFHLLAHLPGFVGDQVKLDVLGTGPGDFEIDAPGDPARLSGLPRTAYKGSSAVVLHRLAQNPWEEGYHIYRSQEIVTVADLRAAKAYRRTPKEEPLCHRCSVSEDLLGESLELLSGHFVSVRFSTAARNLLRGIYGDTRLDAAELKIESVPWDLSPSVRQEPTLNPSHGSGDAAPGTLLHSGEMTMSTTDVAIRGRGFDFAFTRTCRSGIVDGGPLGPGCDHNYRQRLRPLPDGDVEYFAGRGRRELFEREDDSYRATGRFVDLARTATGWVLVDAHRNVFRFDEFGRLASIADAVKESESTGNQMLFHYDLKSRLSAVTDTLDRQIDFTYDDDGRLTEITDFTDREFLYEYDDDGRLETFRTPPVTTFESGENEQRLDTAYTYQSLEGDLAKRLNRRNNCLETTDPKGQTWLELTWDDADGDARKEEVLSQEWGSGTVGLAYDFAAKETIVTDRRGNSSTYRFNAAGQTVGVEDAVDALWSFTYDDEGLMTGQTLPLGRQTDYVFDEESPERRARGNVLTIEVTPDSRGANGSADRLTTTIEYHSVTNRPIRIVDPRGAITEIERTSTGLATKTTRASGEPEESVTQVSYNSFGQPETVTNPNGNVTRSFYFENGDSKGYLREIQVDPDDLRLTTRFETDPRGNVTATIDPRGVRHTREYNALDWPIESRKATSGSFDGAPPLGYKTGRIFDKNGNLAELQIPFADGSGQTLERYEYGVLDELEVVRRQVQPFQAAGEWIVERREYDANLNLERIIDPEGHVTELDYDPRNLVTQSRSGLGAGALAQPITETRVYDNDRQLQTITDGRGHSWGITYDGYGRRQESIDPLSNRTLTRYDNNSNTTSKRSCDSAGPLSESSSTYDLLNRRTIATQWLWQGDVDDPTCQERPSSARGLRSVSTFDPASNLTRFKDSLDRETQYRYDAAERLIEVEDAVGNLDSLALDAAGNAHLTTSYENNPQGAIAVVQETAKYDALNRLVTRTDGLGNSTNFQYDARDQVTEVVDPEVNRTIYFYDGLNRLTSELQPEGIRIDRTYDRSSRLTIYKDALDNETFYNYDSVHRRTSVIYPDSKSENYTYDAAHNLIERIDQSGTIIEQVFDQANRMTSRSVTPAEGNPLEGPLAEAYVYDGLHRMTRAQSGNVVTTLTYDSLSRQLSDRTNGKTVRQRFDDASNPVETTYPASSYKVNRSFDVLDRVRQASNAGSLLVSYSYRGRHLTQSKTLGNGISGQMTFDDARRQITGNYTAASGLPALEERVFWSPRNLKTGQSRADLNKVGFEFAYDKAARLIEAVKSPEPLTDRANNEIPDPESLAGAPETSRYFYDQAQNMIGREKLTYGVPKATELPNDSSGRNRPGSIGDEALSWDANGNLIAKGERLFFYDYRNRLTLVTDTADQELARFTYDAFNRRVKVVAGGKVRETTWNGWQSIEDYENGSLKERRVYGKGLDEAVCIERDLDGNGSLEQTYLPLYDSTGNLVLLTDTQGKPIERISLEPYGSGTSEVDVTPPAVEQARVVQEAIWVELSEEVLASELEAAAADGNLTLYNVTSDEALPIVVSQPVKTGDQARRRMMITTTAPPAEGEDVRLTVGPEALVDVFHNRPATAFEHSFPWPADDAVLVDTQAPVVAVLIVRDGVLEIELTEEVDPAVAGSAIELDGSTTTWTLAEDRYTLVAESGLDSGAHSLLIGTQLLDLAGTALAQPFNTTIVVDAELPQQIIYRRPDPQVTEKSSPIGNRFAFHGLPKDPETGFVYVRNRYYDPEMGRFITTDPLGYVDGPSMYQFAGYNTFNNSDPMGLNKGSTEEVKAAQAANAARLARQAKIKALKERLYKLRFDIALREYLLPFEGQNKREQAGHTLYGLGFSQGDVTAIMSRVLGPAGTCESDFGSQVLCSGASRMAGFAEVSNAGLELILAIGGGAEGLANLGDDAIRGLVRLFDFDSFADDALRHAFSRGDDLFAELVPRVRSRTRVEFAGREKQEYHPDLSHLTGREVELRNRMIEIIIREDFPNLRLTHIPEYNPFIPRGVAAEGLGTQIGYKQFGKRSELRNTIIHEELHHRWWKRGLVDHHPKGSAREKRFYDTIYRYERFRGFKE